MSQKRIIYTKKAPLRFPQLRKRLILPFFLVIAGLLIILYGVLPIIFFQIYNLTSLKGGNLTSPIPDVLATSILNLSGVDYSKASNWFPKEAIPDKKNVSPPPFYLLSIEKLGIKEAVVSTTSDDLFKNLIHYGGSSLPGQAGNSVVFGHSTLPQFFNPKNYKTIFSTLHTLKIGDEIEANLDGIVYKYSIFEIKVVEPQDTSVLEQQYDDSYLTLITCTPPGTYWKRLIIKGKIKTLASR